mmetsp:Transcript_42223/g.82866  ORF Transcript_42223/g.82866 Transcript_42223/m.82866 type:complete len:414 (+) Transcript_42223:196-1437(+)|eukprot:CAMPEP_0194327316 /NCGR_PEP_ID=MMETSP0171-20130528/40541_1 /TAXON_ID=218684 /ORGANISM="Corethron pennatum, Strain L29A3" /LENGTH=413 /DNA_ID=CAMNT_0039087231 /DNA_START=143 /DNA_END=1384 /DNA_ORIENTATION=-
MPSQPRRRRRPALPLLFLGIALLDRALPALSFAPPSPRDSLRRFSPPYLFSTLERPVDVTPSPFIFPIAPTDLAAPPRVFPIATTDPAAPPLVRPKIGAPMPSGPRPAWFRVPGPSGSPDSRYAAVAAQIKSSSFATVCEEAACPNQGECWSGGTATIMLLGDACTRGCAFCNVDTDRAPPPPDPFEPFSAAQAVCSWDVDYVVLTSVDRDDMEDGGAGHFATTVELIKFNRPEMLVECLVSDFGGNKDSVRRIARSGLDVYAHNVETVRRLQSAIRDPKAGYDQSLGNLAYAKAAVPGMYTKTSIMLGLGETEEEVVQTMKDLRAIDVDVVTFGQYLRPTERHLSVVEYIRPEKFDMYRQLGEEMGFKYVASGPMVRSSYKAGEFYLEHLIKKERKAETVGVGALENGMYAV